MEVEQNNICKKIDGFIDASLIDLRKLTTIASLTVRVSRNFGK